MSGASTAAIVMPSLDGIAIHWDVDGVLVESEFLHLEKLSAVSARHGVHLDPTAFSTPQTFAVPDASGALVPTTMSLHGAGDKNIYYWVLGKKPELADRLPMKDWLRELLAYYIEQRHRIGARGEIASLVAAFHAAGAIQGVVTSGISEQVESNLTAVKEVAHLFAFVLTADSVKQSKPHPEGYLLARKLSDELYQGADGHALHRSIAIEDSPAGVRAALAAGNHCVQFVLPGQQPYAPPASEAARLRVAYTCVEVAQCVVEFASEAMAELSLSIDFRRF